MQHTLRDASAAKLLAEQAVRQVSASQPGEVHPLQMVHRRCGGWAWVRALGAVDLPCLDWG